MEKISKMTEALTGGVGKLTGHVDNMVRGLEKALRLAQQIGNISPNSGGFFNNGGGGNLNIGQGPGMGMQQPVFTGSLGQVASNAAQMAAGAGYAAFKGAFGGILGSRESVTAQAAISRVSAFTGMGVPQTENLVRRLNAQGLPVSPEDVISGLYEGRSRGVILNEATYSSLAAMSNLTPGLGIAGAMQVRGGMNQARSVNMARMIGINLRDQLTGKQATFQSSVDQIFETLKRMDGGRTPTRDKLLNSYQPGMGLWNLLHDIFGDDELTIGQVLNGLLYKAAGGQGYGTEDIRRLGFATAAQQQLGQKQGATGALTVDTAPVVAKGVELISKLITDVIQGIRNGIQGKGFLGYMQGPFNSLSNFAEGRHLGGKVEKGQPYVVGEQEAELFIPSESGVIVPGKKGGAFDKSSWATAFLSRAGVPISDRNLQVMLAWMNQEGGHSNNTAYYNPLNTSRKMTGELGTMGKQGNIRQYASWGMGMEATLQTINNGLYKGVLEALRDPNASKEDIFQAIVSSDWGTKSLPTRGASGRYDANRYKTSGAPGAISGTAPSGVGASGGDPWRASTDDPWRASTVNYGGVSINIAMPNGGQLSVKDLVEEIKKQLSYDSIVNYIRSS